LHVYDPDTKFAVCVKSDPTWFVNDSENAKNYCDHFSISQSKIPEEMYPLLAITQVTQMKNLYPKQFDSQDPITGQLTLETYDFEVTYHNSANKIEVILGSNDSTADIRGTPRPADGIHIKSPGYMTSGNINKIPIQIYWHSLDVLSVYASYKVNFMS
jgi:hypothetical protein